MSHRGTRQKKRKKGKNIYIYTYIYIYIWIYIYIYIYIYIWYKSFQIVSNSERQKAILNLQRNIDLI